MNIKIIYTKKHMIHNPPFEIYDGVRESYAEKPARIEAIVEMLKRIGITTLTKPRAFPLRHIHATHYREYVRFLRRRSGGLRRNNVLFPSYFIMDTYTPVTRGTFEAARSSVNVALTGSNMILEGEQYVYALCRPPGHHAETARMGGYCYFNNAAIAAEYLSNSGKVAILDIDFHHGNGTQEIFYNRKDVLYVSIHADPRVKFPYSSGFSLERGVGEGYGFTKNYPLPLGSNELIYQRVLQKALFQIKGFNPRFLVVSAGFDTYIHDPIGGFKLSIPFYKIIGKDIASLGIPTLLVQEGGYNVKDLGKIVISFLKGFTS